MSRRDLFRSRSVVSLLAAEVISTTGAQMTWLALPWFVLVTTGSATKMSFVVAAELIGVAALGLPGGRLLGKIGARRTMLVCDGARAPLMLVIPFLHWTAGLSFAVLLVRRLRARRLAAPYFAAQKVIVPELLGEDEKRVLRGERPVPGGDADDLLLGPALGRRADRRDRRDQRPPRRRLHLHGLARPCRGLRPAAAAGQQAEGGPLDPRGHPVHPPGPAAPRLGAVFALGDAAWNAFFIAVPVLVLERFGHHPQIAGWLFAAFGSGAVLGNVITFRWLDGTLRRTEPDLGLHHGQALPLWCCGCRFPAVLAAALSCQASRAAWSTRACTRSRCCASRPRSGRT